MGPRCCGEILRPLAVGKGASMPKVVVTSSLTLDGVMQAPGRTDEDRRGGFGHGGWAVPYADSVMASAMAEGIAKS